MTKALPSRAPGSLTCNGAIQIPEDGTSGGFTDSLGAGGTNFYVQTFLSGHSYSADVWDPFEQNQFKSPFVLSVIVNCGISQVSVDTSTWAPYLSPAANADRISWIVSSDSTHAEENILLTNNDTVSSHMYYIRITDTTLHNPRWSTFSGFITQYAFVNVSDHDISGTLTVYDNTSTLNSPVVLAVANITVTAGGEDFFTVSPTGNPPVPANHFGFATFAFVGPPGAVRADAYAINPNATVVVQSTFGPISEPH